MANRPPVAVLTAETTQVILPQNRVKLYSGQSYDPGRRGRIVRREYYQASGKGTANFDEINDDLGTCEVIFPDIAGIYVVGVEVYDKAGLMNEEPAEVRITVLKNDVKTLFGAHGTTVTNPALLENIAGKPSVSRFSEVLADWNGRGNTRVSEFLKAGHTVFININEKQVGRDAQGDKVANPFPKNLDKYKQQVEQVFQYYENNPYKERLIMCCENEPTTGKFHSGPMSDYLAMLGKVFIPLCKEYGFKGTDGGVHVSTVLGADLDKITGEGKAYQVTELLRGYAKIPDMYAVAVHTSNVGKDQFDINSIPKAVNKIKGETGYPSTSNEWHVDGTEIVDSLVDIAQGMFDAHMLQSVYISSSGSGINLNDGMTLNKWGAAYKKFISEHK